MADIYIQRAHDSGLETARHAAQQVAEKISDQFGVSYHWEDDTLHFDHPGVNGYIIVSEQDILLNAELGLLLRIFKSSIESEIHRQLDENFD